MLHGSFADVKVNSPVTTIQALEGETSQLLTEIQSDGNICSLFL